MSRLPALLDGSRLVYLRPRILLLPQWPWSLVLSAAILAFSAVIAAIAGYSPTNAALVGLVATGAFVLITVLHEVAHAVAGICLGRRFYWFQLGAKPAVELGVSTRDGNQLLISGAGLLAQAMASCALLGFALTAEQFGSPMHDGLGGGGILGLGHALLSLFAPIKESDGCKIWGSIQALIRRRRRLEGDSARLGTTQTNEPQA